MRWRTLSLSEGVVTSLGLMPLPQALTSRKAVEVKIDWSSGRAPSLYNELFRFVQPSASRTVPVDHLEWIH